MTRNAPAERFLPSLSSRGLKCAGAALRADARSRAEMHRRLALRRRRDWISWVERTVCIDRAIERPARSAVSAGPDVLPVHQGRDRGVPHHEAGRLDTAGRGVHERRGRAGVRTDDPRGRVGRGVSGGPPGGSGDRRSVAVGETGAGNHAPAPGVVCSGSAGGISRGPCGANPTPRWRPPSPRCCPPCHRAGPSR